MSIKDMVKSGSGVLTQGLKAGKAQWRQSEGDEELDSGSTLDRSTGLHEGPEPGLYEVPLGQQEEKGQGFQGATLGSKNTETRQS